MADQNRTTDPTGLADPALAAEIERLGGKLPVQARSRARYERILRSAEVLLVEKGAEALKMSDLVEATGVAFGSLYQFFPDKRAVIGVLALRYNQVGRACVAGELSHMTSLADLRPTLGRIVDGYYEMFERHPAMVEIWGATQADHVLRDLDCADGLYLAALVEEALARVRPGRAEGDAVFARLVITLIAAAVRDAITMPAPQARMSLAAFKRLLPQAPL